MLLRPVCTPELCSDEWKWKWKWKWKYLRTRTIINSSPKLLNYNQYSLHLIPPELSLTQPYSWNVRFRHAATPDPVESPSSENISCPDCGRVFTGRHRVPVFKRHYRTVHLKIQLYSCDFCQRKFAHDNSRKRHAKICRLKMIEMKLRSCAGQE